jgi:DNA-binding MarR family transcriptional regulator
MKNYRLLKGFGQVSVTVMRNPTISVGEKAVYAYLSTYANSVTNETFVSVTTIAAETGLGYSTVKRYLKKLEEKEIIKRKPRGSKQSCITILIK